MSKVMAKNVMKTEGDWLDAISTASKVPRQTVEEALLRHGVRAQSTPPRAKKVWFRSLSFAGTKVGSNADGPFQFVWDDLGPGLWAVMSDRNHRGKSSIMNMLQAALRGDFPGRMKADVWKWLSRLEIGFRIDATDYKLLIEKDSGIETVERATARLSRQDDNVWIDLYAGTCGEGLKTQTESLFLDELGFTRIHASTQSGTAYTHSWPAVSSALFIGGHSESKALFGDILTDGLPLRLLQLFIGLPWVSTLTAASTAAKLLELDAQKRDRSSDYLSAFRNRLIAAEAELQSEREKPSSSYERVDLRRDMNRLDAELVQSQTDIVLARAKVESLTSSQNEVVAARDEIARLVQQLKDEQAAGYLFRQLRPVCCPACEADFHASSTAQPDNETCPLCKNALPLETEIADERLEIAKHDFEDAVAALKIVRVNLKAAEKVLQEAEAEKKKIETELTSVQTRLGYQSDDRELHIAELTATAKELRDLLGDNVDQPNDAKNPDKVILDAAITQTKRMFEDLQKDVLKDVSDAVKLLSIKFGVQNIAEMTLNGAGHLNIVQGGAETSFSKLTDGERLRVKIAAALAAVEVARQRGLGRHPGLLLLDSPGAEEVASQDFHEMLLSVSTAAKEMGGVQIIIGTIYREELEGVVAGNHRKHAQKDSFLF